MTGLEAMAAWLGRRMHGEEWADLDARTRASMLEDARELLGLYEAERWRVPTTGDWESEKEFDVILAVYGGQWTGPNRGTLDDMTPDEAMGLVMIADPIPLPPAPGGGEA